MRKNLDNVRKLINSLENQEYPRFEVIIVDDRSEDEIREFLKEVDLNSRKTRVIYIEETPGRLNPKKYALTLGIKAARYEHLLFTDDDCLPVSENWIWEMNKKFSSGSEIVLGYSPYRKYKGLLNALIRYETFYTGLQYLGFALAKQPFMGVGRNLAYTKSLFFSRKGFHKHVFVNGGDDDLFINDAATPTNTVVQFSTDSLMVSEPKQSFKTWLHQKRRHLSVGKYYKLTNKLKLALLSFSWIFFWFSAIGLGILVPDLIAYAGIGFLLRELTLGIIYGFAAKKLSEKLNVFELLMHDFLYLFCYLIFAFNALFTRKKTWD